MVQGLGAAGTAPLAMALAGDLNNKRTERGMGILEAANGIGKVLSPIIGAAVALIVWYAFFPMPCFLFRLPFGLVSGGGDAGKTQRCLLKIFKGY